ncbi:MAG: hypothetical protein ACXVEF_43080 [Polyangiales bacterium]
MRALRLGVLALVFAVNGCATYESELQRGEEHFTHDEHEAALATFRALEGDWFTLSIRDRARYCYLRGMTDYRLGFKADARHWLAIGLQIDKDNPGALAPSEKTLVEEKLGELNLIVWAGDVLPIEEPPGTKAPKKVEKTTTEPKAEDAAEEPAPAKKKKKSDDDDDSPKPKKKKSSDE